MHRNILNICALGALLMLGAVALWLWAFDGAHDVAAWAADGQRHAQSSMATALRALKTGQPGALWSLWGLCFAYGVFHAGGPGHGKILIGGYGVARRVSALRLSVLALASSLAQSATAVLLVGFGAGLWAMSRDRLTTVADSYLAPLSYGLISIVGAWLAIKGLMALRFATIKPIDLATVPDHHIHHENCGCGHAHGPTIAQIDGVQSLRDALLLIATIAIRPCTGALFVLLITWRMGILPAGIGGAFAMGIGTASVTIAVALAAVFARETALKLQPQSPNRFSAFAALLWPLLQIVAGGIVLTLSLQLMMMAL